jgi:hypothetical protein
MNQRSSWWLLQGCPPLPIPNREVKPLSADDTWVIPGKVCRCRILKEPHHSNMVGFFCLIVVSYQWSVVSGIQLNGFPGFYKYQTYSINEN